VAASAVANRADVVNEPCILPIDKDGAVDVATLAPATETLSRIAQDAEHLLTGRVTPFIRR
jgi:hypothetical protein